MLVRGRAGLRHRLLVPADAPAARGQDQAGVDDELRDAADAAAVRRRERQGRPVRLRRVRPHRPHRRRRLQGRQRQPVPEHAGQHHDRVDPQQELHQAQGPGRRERPGGADAPEPGVPDGPQGLERRDGRGGGGGRDAGPGRRGRRPAVRRGQGGRAHAAAPAEAEAAAAAAAAAGSHERQGDGGARDGLVRDGRVDRGHRGQDLYLFVTSGRRGKVEEWILDRDRGEA